MPNQRASRMDFARSRDTTPEIQIREFIGCMMAN